VNRFKNMGVSRLSLGKNSSCYPFSGEVLVTEKMLASSLFNFCSFPFSDGP
jgi:hypothetical protein